MARNPWSIYKRLRPLDIKILKAVEAGHRYYGYVPLEYIEKRVRAIPKRILESIDRLNEAKLIVRRIGYTTGYKLTYTGLDIIALSNLVARGVIAVLGERIGVGKEGNIYLAEDPAGNPVVVKFHREGLRSFQGIKRKRAYVADLPRKSWLRMAKLVGEREFKIMALLKDAGARVPEPIAWNRHAVVQEYVPGVELYKVRGLDTEEAYTVLKDVMKSVRIAYEKVGVVHGDLSEYNILVTEELEAYIIDWPQFLYREQEGAEELLERDIGYVVSFFNRRFGLLEDASYWVEYVRGGAGSTG